MAVSYLTLYLPGSSQGIQVVEGSQLHLIYVAMGANSIPSAPGQVVRQDPFPQYVDGDELAAALAAALAGLGSGTATPDATTSEKGKVQLAGDLAGTADAPTVPGLTSRVSKGALTLNIADYGAVGDNSTVNTTAIQAALDAARTAGGGHVYVPPGTFRTGALTIGARVRLYGAGAASVLRHSGGAGNLLSLYAQSADMVTVENLFLECIAQTSGNGIHLDNSAIGYTNGTEDSHHVISNVWINQPAGHGVYMSTQVREARLYHVTVSAARGGHGFHIQSTDCFFSMCTASATPAGFHGFNIDGPNHRFVGCKAFYCGATGNASDGFYVGGPRNELSACEAQDNGRYGFNFAGSLGMHNTASALMADSNAAGGINIDNSGFTVYALSLVGFVALSRTGGRYTQAVGVRFATQYPARSQVIGVALNNTTDVVLPADTATAQSTTILIQGAPGVTAGLTIDQTALDAKAARVLAKTAVAANYTVVAADAVDKVLHSTSATGVTITAPQDSAATIAQEASIPWRQYGAGQITFAAGAGATLISRGSVFKSAGQYAEGLLTKTAANTWLLSGDISA